MSRGQISDLFVTGNEIMKGRGEKDGRLVQSPWIVGHLLVSKGRRCWRDVNC